MARGERLGGADVILAQQENLDREVRVGQQGRESNKFVEHSYRRVTLRRLTDRRNLAVLVDAHDPTFTRYRVHQCEAGAGRAAHQALCPKRRAARVHLDELAICANQVDHEPADRRLRADTRSRQYRCHRSMQRPFANHPDAQHGARARRALGIHPCVTSNPRPVPTQIRANSRLLHPPGGASVLRALGAPADNSACSPQQKSARRSARSG